MSYFSSFADLNQFLVQYWRLMKLGRQELEIKTQISQQSNIDVFSKLEVSFLEKFFNYNLNDYFPDLFANFYEDLLERKVSNRNQKSLSANLFRINNNFLIEELQATIQNFYKKKSKSIIEEDLPFAFKYQYCNRDPVPNLLTKGELVFVSVKIKAEVQRIQEYPEQIMNNLQYLRQEKRRNLTTFEKILSTYSKQYFNIFVVYFGDCNFNYFRKDNYRIQNIRILGKTFKLRIFVFYVSKQALVESFRVINKLNNIEYINDILIQFYELKRQKQRRKRRKEMDLREKEKNSMKTIYKIVLGTFSLLLGGLAMRFLFVKFIKKN